ncbi:hypothetical protein STSP2_02340 [Anaerohalosphaera lusitana]|uniref:NfeD-like C-terminal domain-containing protein n=1 Tax=Anaerohalosphaera lusitana TaxID=1936003 RepID=A0A1U9NML6_9BACT|nr:NfeD family protein [Anaerohalosphaera lusitana]AQT69153.1 hypothetical protein STSP2_02340 [Anaerohalosphaera lusitana]
MDWWLLLAIFLYLVSAALFVAEVFVPSGGIISIFALTALGGGVALFFRHSTEAGIGGVVLAIVLIPATLIFAYKQFPKTKFGKSVTLQPPTRDRGDAVPDGDRLSKLTGQTGIVLSAMRPVGQCEFDGKRIECVADRAYVPKGKKVKVIRVQGMKVTVRPIESEERV